MGPLYQKKLSVQLLGHVGLVDISVSVTDLAQVELADAFADACRDSLQFL